MDLVKLQKKAILIPTPGQTEQEYLAKYLMERIFFYTISQKEFVLQKVLNHIDSFPFIIVEHNMNRYKNIIDKFVLSL